MPIKFLGVERSNDEVEKGSSLANGKYAYYTAEEIAGDSAYTETIVNISSAEILAMGTAAIELLSDPGVGNYYDIDKVVIENVVDGLPYQLTNDNLLRLHINGNSAYFSPAVLFEFFPTLAMWRGETNRIIDISGDGDIVTFMSEQFPNGSALLLSTIAGSPTDGTNGLRVKIYHKTITFGA